MATSKLSELGGVEGVAGKAKTDGGLFRRGLSAPANRLHLRHAFFGVFSNNYRNIHRGGDRK
jgi:hypothetical protein